MKAVVAWFFLSCCRGLGAGAPLERVRVAADGRGFMLTESQREFRPWGMNYGNAARLMKSLISVHLYPDPKKTGDALESLRQFAVGKPILIEETFPLSCTPAKLEDFLRASREFACGWIGHYDGHTPGNLDAIDHDGKLTMAQGIHREWLRMFVRLGPEFASPVLQ